MPLRLTGPLVIPSTLSRWPAEVVAHDFERSEVAPTLTYVIADTPGSEAAELAWLMRSTGGMGAPLPYFDLDSVTLKLARLWDTNNWADYVTELTARRTSPNGVFGAMLSQAALAEFSLFNIHFVPDHLIIVRRRDPVVQAVAAAYQSLTTLLEGEPEYSSVFVESWRGRVAATNASFEALCGLFGIEPFYVALEDLRAAPETTLLAIREEMTISVNSKPIAECPLDPPVRVPARWVKVHREEVASKARA